MQHRSAARQPTQSQPSANWHFRFTAGRMRPKEAPVCASSRVYSTDALGVVDVSMLTASLQRRKLPRNVPTGSGLLEALEALDVVDVVDVVM